MKMVLNTFKLSQYDVHSWASEVRCQQEVVHWIFRQNIQEGTRHDKSRENITRYDKKK